MKGNPETKKATKAIIHLGTIPLDVYQMPDQSYRLCVDSVTGALEKQRKDLLKFIKGRSKQALPFKNYALVQAPLVPTDGDELYFKPIPINLATAYWHYHSKKNNDIADALVQACMIESIERRADTAFKFKRTEKEYNRRFGRNLEKVLMYNRKEIIERRLMGDDLYYPPGIN
ncbi:MAG: hypothetical protein ACRCU2_06315 [Planktothrix sp.]